MPPALLVMLSENANLVKPSPAG